METINATGQAACDMRAVSRTALLARSESFIDPQFEDCRRALATAKAKKHISSQSRFSADCRSAKISRRSGSLDFDAI
jgi:hypothetical protein